MVSVQRSWVCLVLLLLLASPASAWINDTVSVEAPLNGSFLRGTTALNISFSGTANVTVHYNTTPGTYLTLNTTTDRTDGWNTSWPTANTSFADGPYGLRVNVTNATDVSDYLIVIIGNLTVDNTKPVFSAFTSPLAAFAVADGSSFSVNISVTDAAIAEGADCTPKIDLGTATFTGTVRYHAAQGTCNGTLTIGDPSGLADGGKSLTVNVSDRAGNQNVSNAVTIVIDNTAPTIASPAYNDRSPANTSQLVELTATVSDTNNVSAVWITNGTTNWSLTLRSGNNASGLYNISFNLSTVNCAESTLCAVTLGANDTAGNVLTTTPVLYIDADSPVLLAAGINASNAVTGDNITISAQWLDVVLYDVYGYLVRFFADVGEGLLEGNAYLARWNNSDLVGNFTNVTYRVNGSDEGKNLTFVVNFTDNNSRNIRTGELSILIANVSPRIALLFPTNNSYIQNGTPIQLRFSDIGAGVNFSNLSIAIPSHGAVINYSSNGTLFTCAALQTQVTGSSTDCNLSLTWLTGEVNLSINLTDNRAQRNTTWLSFVIVQQPDVENITMRGVRLVNATAANVSVRIEADTTEIEINWTVATSVPINTTALRFLNDTLRRNATSLDIPATSVFNLTAGKHALIINATLNNSPLTDTVQLNLTANVPLNASHLASQYERGMLIDWTVREDGVDVTLSDRHYNATVDVVANVTNTTADIPYRIVLNYTGLDGLALRWNASPDAFGMSPVTTAELATLAAQLRANVTIALTHTGQTQLFFDEQPYLVTATVNTSAIGRAFYYQARNSSHTTTYQLRTCAATPTSALNASDACMVSENAQTVLFLPRFSHDDRILVAQGPLTAPNLTILTAAAQNQSTLPIRFAAVTALPNASFCSYTLGRWNTSNNISTVLVQDNLTVANMSMLGLNWTFETNLSYYTNGVYNLTVSCADTTNQSNTTHRAITLTDTTPPVVSEVLISDISRVSATISGEADEPSTFTAEYGTSSSLGQSVEGTGPDLFSDTIVMTLNAETIYFANLTACDLNGVCGSTAAASFTTADAGNRGGGGGGGGGGAEGTTPDMVTSKVWGYVKAGDEVTFSLKGFAITIIELLFSKDVDKALLEFKQYNAAPDTILPAPGVTYKYFQIIHEGLQGNVARYRVHVRVPDSWMQQHGITSLALYRLETEWVAYPLTGGERVGTEVEYTVDVPGFSYFAIAGSGTDNDTVTVPVDPQTPVEQTPDAPQQNETVLPQPQQPSGGFVSALEDEPMRLPGWLSITLIVLIAVGSAAGGLQYYKRYQRKQQEHDEQVAREQKQYELQKKARAGSPTAELQEYVLRMRAKAIPDDEIKNRLLATGWDELVVEQELAREQKA